LKLAFSLKANANPGEPMPNPATDDSFARFMKDKVFLAALDEIRTAERLFPDRLDFSAPGVPWVMTVPAEDFQIAETRQSPDGRVNYFLFTSVKNGFSASIYIEPADKCTDSKSCRDFVRTSTLPNVPDAENVSSSEIGEVSVFEYFVRGFRGQPVRAHNMNAEFVRDGFWVDLHISKVRYEPQDRKSFEALVRSVKFEKK